MNTTAPGVEHSEPLDRAGVQDVRKRQIAVGIGNFMEWFDFAVYGYFVAIIGAQFFPSGDATAELLASLAVFAVGFVARPLGAVILGPIGDRFGRKWVLVVTVLGMGIATACIGMVPPHAVIGVAAPVLIVVLRCVQGMMVGGEWSSAATYLGESAPPARRALHASLVTATAGAAFLTGTLTATLLTAAMSDESLNSWGWRIPFLASFVMAIVAVYIRRKLDDTPVFEHVAQQRTAGTIATVPFSEKLRSFVISFAFSALFGVSLYYLITYANNHLSGTVGMPRVSALTACAIALAIYVVLNPLLGALSDRIGRRPLVLTASVGLTVLALPIFLLWGTGEFILVLSGLVLLALLVAMTAVMNVTLLVEVFPASIRSAGAAIGYNAALAVLAGPGPLIAAWLIAQTGNGIAPAYYLAAVSALCGIVLWKMLPETRGVDISRG